MNQTRVSKWSPLPPWILIPAALGALALALVAFGRDYSREQRYFTDLILGRGEMLIHSLELVGRTRFGESWEAGHLTEFWNNLEDSDNVLFLALTEKDGTPAVVIGEMKPPPNIFSKPSPDDLGRGALVPNFRLAEINGRQVALVYRTFRPMPLPGPRKHYQPSKGVPEVAPKRPWQHGSERLKYEYPAMHDSVKVFRRSVAAERVVWVAFDLGPFEELSRSRIRMAGLFIGLLFIAALGGVLALFWGHNSRLTRRMYQDTTALAAELIGRLPIGMFLVDGSGRVTLVNRAALSISGYREEDFMGRTLGEVTGNRFPDAETMSGREIALDFTGGNSVLLAVTSGPVISEDGHALGRVILMEDLGELGRLKAELTKQERLAALGGMAAGLAHEIRNPLGAIRGLAQHLLNKNPASAQDREALEVMLTSVDRLGSTITDFLNYAKPTEIRPERFDLVELVNKMATLAGHDAKAKQVDIVLNLPPEPIWTLGDEALLSQAFLNIYLNGIEAAGGGGRLEVNLKADGRRAFITFCDNGPGFSAEQLEHSFVPYFTTKAKGTGLGLAMVEKAVRAHPGADISLANTESGGALVTVTIPCNAADDINDSTK